MRKSLFKTLSIYLNLKMICIILSFKLGQFSKPCCSFRSCFGHVVPRLCLNQGHSYLFGFVLPTLRTSFCLSLSIFHVGKRGEVLYVASSLSALKHCQICTSKLFQGFSFVTKPSCAKLLATHTTLYILKYAFITKERLTLVIP